MKIVRFKFCFVALVLCLLMGWSAGPAAAADFNLTQPSTTTADIATTAPEKVKVGSAAAGAGQKVLIFDQGTGVLDETNSSSTAVGAGGVVTFPAYVGGEFDVNDYVGIYTNDARVSAPFLDGINGVDPIELALGIAGQTAVTGTGAQAVLSAAPAAVYTGNIYIPMRSLMTGGNIPLNSGGEVTCGAPDSLTGNWTVGTNPFLIVGVAAGGTCNTTGTIDIAQGALGDGAGNDLSTNSPLSIPSAVQEGATTVQRLFSPRWSSSNYVDLVRVTNTKVVFRGNIADATGNNLNGWRDGIAINKADANVLVKVLATSGTTYATDAATMTFVNWNSVEISIAQGATLSAWDGATLDATDQMKLYVGTDGKSFLAPATATYATLTDILNLTTAEKAAAGVDDGSTDGTDDGIERSDLDLEQLAGAFTNCRGNPSDAVATVNVNDDAPPWIFKAESRINPGDTGNDGSAQVNFINLYCTEDINSGVFAADRVVVWADTDGAGDIDHDTAASADEIFPMTDGYVYDLNNPEQPSGRGDDVLQLDLHDQGYRIDPGVALRVRFAAAINRLNVFDDETASNYYEPFFGDQTMDACRYYLFNPGVPNTVDPDYTTDWPDSIQVTAGTFGLAVTDKAPPGIEELDLVVSQDSPNEALLYIQFSEAATILDYDGISDAKLTSPNQLFRFEDNGSVTSFTGNLYRMTTGQLNDIKTNGLVVGTNVESDLDGAAGTEFILQMFFTGAGVMIQPSVDTLYVMTWSGNIEDGNGNSTLDTDEHAIGAPVAPPELPVLSRAVYGAGNNYVDLVFTAPVQAVNSNTDTAASAITELNDAFSVYDAGGTGILDGVSVTASIPVSNTIRLTWATSDELPTVTGLTVQYDPTQTANAADEYAVIGHAADASAQYQITSGFTANTVETSYTAKTADLDFDGFIDAIYVDLGDDQLLDTSVTPAATGFVLETSRWKDFNNFAGAEIIVKEGQRLNPSSVTVEDHFDANGVADESFIVLHFDSTFDWNPDLAGVQQPKTDVNAFANVLYSGTDVLTDKALPVPPFYVDDVKDGAAPAILSAQGSGDDIVLDFSENLYQSITGSNDASGFFVFKTGCTGDPSAYVMDMTSWDIDYYYSLSGTNEKNAQVTINTADGGGDAKDARGVYISQKYAVDNSGSYSGEPIRDASPNHNRAGKSIFYADPSPVPASAYQTYDSFTKEGTLVCITFVEYPEMVSARAFWHRDGYYDKILVCLDEPVTVANDLTGTALENSFLISLDTDDQVDSGREIQQLKPDAVVFANTEQTQLLLTISQGRLLTDASQNDVYPVRVCYTDNSDEGQSTTVEFLQDSDTNYMRSGCVGIDTGANDREASPESVEVSGTLQNFNDFRGAMVRAYEAYRFTDWNESATLDIDFGYGPLAKAVKKAFGLTASSCDTSDQCHQEGLYTGIHIGYDDIAGVEYGNALLAPEIPGNTSAQKIKAILDRGFCYLHTDWHGDGQFNFKLSFRRESRSSSVYTEEGFFTADTVVTGAASDSVFYVKFSKLNKKGKFTVKGAYGIKGKGTYQQNATESWRWYTGQSSISQLANKGQPHTVGETYIPVDATVPDYKVLARDEVGEVLKMAESNAEKAIVSRIRDKKVVLTLTLGCEAEDHCNVYLLNGLTPDVDIEYYFYSYDGALKYDPDRLTLFDHALSQNHWNLWPLRVDKVYYTGSKAPATEKKYPDGTDRNTNKVKVAYVSDAIIGLDGDGLPKIANPPTWILGLDKTGVIYGRAQDHQYLKGGFGYAIEEGSDQGEHNAESIYSFGFNIMPSDATDNSNMAGGAMLTANVINVDDASDARSKGKTTNLGWNLIADVEDITLSTATNIDYVITFNLGVFDSWIAGGSLNDFTVITNDYASAFGPGESDEDVAAGYRRGKAYFVHTASD